MPAESVAGTVSVGSDPRAQPFRLLNELLPCHYFEIPVHTTSLTGRGERTSRSVVRRTHAMSCGPQRRQLHGVVRRHLSAQGASIAQPVLTPVGVAAVHPRA